jgi:uncharacterized delta-60 repeat protein
MHVVAPRFLTSTAVLVVVLMAGFAFSTVARAAPGDLDATFSGDGKQLTNFGPGSSQASAIVRQPDGKIVAAGANESSAFAGSSGFGFALARYNPDGSLDPSFSANGKQTTRFSGAYGATGVVLQADGKIVVVGGIDGFDVARYNPNGSLDPSFSGDGKQTTYFGGASASAVAIQADGKIVVAGASGPDAKGNADFAVARYNPNGSLDPSFSGDGKQTTNFGGNDFASDVAIEANGKIVAVGANESSASPFGSAFALARYNPNGSLDPTFSGDGRQTTVFGHVSQANGVAIQADGRIVAAGEDFTNGGFALARYNPNGSLDPTFSGDGKQTTSGFGGANAVAIRTDGKIVAVGEAKNDFALARYNPNGTLDPAFSGDGKQTTDFGGLDEANGVALQPDGTVVAGGDGDHGVFALARYRANGSLDPSFSGDGRQTTVFGGRDEGNAVAIQTDGKIVAVGDAAPGGFGLARYTSNGSLDPTFSGDGKQTTATPDFGAGGASGVAMQADGKIVAVGSARYGFGLARYNPNGSLDPSFSGDGIQTTDFGCVGGCADANAVAIQPDGKIVAVGVVDSGGGFAIARYNPNGSLDPTFSGDGEQTTYFDSGARAVAIQADGKIVVIGASGGDFAVVRYNPNGSLDPTFSGDGVQATDFGGGDGASGVAIQTDGKIVAVGGGGSGNDFALARYNPNGSLDATFSGDGKETTDLGGGDSATGVALQADGRIVVAGVTYRGDHGDFALARYNSDGSLDMTFSGNGVQTTDFGSGDGARGVALQADGKIVAVGSALGTDLSSDFALARFLGG